MHVFDVDVAKIRREITASIAEVVVCQSEYPGFSYLKVFNVDILNVSAPVEVGLTVQHSAAVVVAGSASGSRAHDVLFVSVFRMSI